MWIVVCVLNYTPRVRIDNGPKNRAIWLFYWTTLILYLCETLVKLLSVLLDVTYDIAPVIQKQFPDDSSKGLIAILSGLRLAFHSRLFLFFWNKLFHGDKDLFSVSYSNLERERETMSNYQGVRTSADEADNN